MRPALSSRRGARRGRYGHDRTDGRKDAPRPPATRAPAAALAARERQSHVRHELRAPLAVIYPLLSMLLDDGAGELTPQQREFLEVLERNVVRLEALVAGVADSGWADLLAPPRCRRRGQPLRRRRGDRHAPPPRRPQGRRSSSTPGRRPRCSRGRTCDDVRQIVTDLVRNAVTYTPSDGRVTVRVAAGIEHGTVQLEVADTGPGMPPEELARALEFGFRGELPRRLRAPGLGAGLWVSRELAARNGGRLSLASEVGAGLRATLVLPTARGDA